MDTDEDEEDEEDEENVENVEDEEDEILLKNKESDVKTESEIDDFIKLCRNYFDKKQQTKKENINGTSNEIILEKEKETCHDEKNNTLDNRSESSTLQLNASDIKSKLCSSEKNDTLHTNMNDTKNESCNNEESNNSLANVKDKIRKRKMNKESLKSDNVDATSKHNNKKLKSQDKNEILDSKSSKRKKSKLNVQEVKKKCKANNKMEKHEEENKDYLPNLEFEDPKRKPILDSPLEETISRETPQKGSDLTNLKTINNATREPAGISYEAEIDPKKYVNIKPKHLKTQLPDVTTGGDEDSEQEEETHKIMSEAFADDDVVEEFRKEKEEEVHIKIFNKNYTSYTYKKNVFTICHVAFSKKYFCWNRCINIE